jgi:hypothetical protein
VGLVVQWALRLRKVTHRQTPTTTASPRRTAQIVFGRPSFSKPSASALKDVSRKRTRHWRRAQSREKAGSIADSWSRRATLFTRPNIRRSRCRRELPQGYVIDPQIGIGPAELWLLPELKVGQITDQSVGRRHLAIAGGPVGPLPIALPSTGAVADAIQAVQGDAVPAPPMHRPPTACVDSQCCAEIPIFGSGR